MAELLGAMEDAPCSTGWPAASTAARVADLRRPGPVLLRLAVTGFRVTLPPA